MADQVQGVTGVVGPVGERGPVGDPGIAGATQPAVGLAGVQVAPELAIPVPEGYATLEDAIRVLWVPRAQGGLLGTQDGLVLTERLRAKEEGRLGEYEAERKHKDATHRARGK